MKDEEIDMEYMKKQSFGGLRACEKKEATHVLQSTAEYTQMINIASMYRESMQKAEARKEKAENKSTALQAENRQLQAKISSLKKDIEKSSQAMDQISVLEQEKRDLKARIAKLEDDVSQEKILNRNLLRIARERANADRRIFPKKQHDGYIVLQSREWRERLADRFVMHTWKSIIQTPYDSSMNLEIAGVHIFDDLVNFVLSDIGVTKYVSPEDSGHCFRSEDAEDILYCWRFVSDFRSGYISAIIYTTGQLVVSPDRRARQYREGTKKSRPRQKT